MKVLSSFNHLIQFYSTVICNVNLIRTTASKLDKYDLFSLSDVQYCTAPLQVTPNEVKRSPWFNDHSTHHTSIFYFIQKKAFLGLEIIHLILSIIHTRRIW
jgi:hypothetical protein